MSSALPLSPARRRRITPARIALWSIVVLATLAVLAWAGAVTTLWMQQESKLFKPVTLAADEPLSADADVHERFVDVPGARLSVLELRNPNPRGVVFFLHGNSGNLRKWYTDGTLFRRANLDLVMMDYRGFGKSTGHIETERQLHDDVEAVWQAVAPRYAGRKVVVYGRSLGSGLAAFWAARHQPDLTLLVSPYTSMVQVTAEQYPWVPSFALRYPLHTDRVIQQIKHPVLLLHGDQDALIPFHHSVALKALMPEATLVNIAGAGHSDIHRFELYRQAMAQALMTAR